MAEVEVEVEVVVVFSRFRWIPIWWSRHLRALEPL
jgi:hypothetical protein